MVLPKIIQELIDQLAKLPGVGPKTAQRYAFDLLKKPKKEIEKLSLTLKELKDKVLLCKSCFNYSESDLCPLCKDPQRNKKQILVVSEPQDVEAIEKTSEYKGLYHVLGGVINQIEGITPDKLRIKELILRIKKEKPQEVILGLNPDLEGETTALYLQRVLKPFKIKITRLARGLPTGSDLDYADEITLSFALKNRKEVR